MFDPAEVPYTIALGLRPLATLGAADRRLLASHVAALRPRPNSISVLTPVGPVPADRRPFGREMPQAFGPAGYARIVILALRQAGDSARVDLHSLILLDGRVSSSQLLAEGLSAASLRGVAANGRFELGFSVSDRTGGLGDLFRLRPSRQQFGIAPGSQEWAENFRWVRIRADTPERKLDIFAPS